MSQLYLGDELVVEGILLRLPVKSLLRLRCVCKSWSSLISCPNFISSQLRNSRNNDTQLIVHQWDELIRSVWPSAIRLFDLEDSRYQPVLLLNFGFEPPNGTLHLVGNAGGLICYYAVQRDGDLLSKFIIFNPEIQSILSVTPPRHVKEKTSISIIKGFGFDDTTLDYKIFLAAPNRYVYIYSLNSKTWNLISGQFSRRNVSGDCAIFVKDCFHWLTYGGHNRPSIMVFDIKSETFRLIILPKHMLGHLRIITGFGESSIGIVQVLNRHLFTLTHVWLMNQNGSWFKIADDGWLFRRIEEKEVLGFRNKDELLITNDSRRPAIVSQNIKTKVVRDVLSTDAQGCFRYRVHTHVPSLTLLGVINSMNVLFLI